MPSYSRNDVVLIRSPFSDLSGGKVRPAIIVNAAHLSQDLFIVPLTSRTSSLLPGEFLLGEWKEAGLNVPSVVKRGLYTVHTELCLKKIGAITQEDQNRLDTSLSDWLQLAVFASDRFLEATEQVLVRHIQSLEKVSSIIHEIRSQVVSN
jgi:mRNA interferase MazF